MLNPKPGSSDDEDDNDDEFQAGQATDKVRGLGFDSSVQGSRCECFTMLHGLRVLDLQMPRIGRVGPFDSQ